MKTLSTIHAYVETRQVHTLQIEDWNRLALYLATLARVARPRAIVARI